MINAEKIKNEINSYVKNWQEKSEIRTIWREPLVAFADTSSPLFEEHQKLLGEKGLMPQDVLDSAKTAIVYFLPFSKDVIESNDKKESSAEWMIAYVETNQLIEKINKHLAEYLNDEGFETSLFSSTSSHEQQAQDRFHSVWSHRHVAHIAGLGKFGLNNMFITEVGCGGRLGSFVTNFVPEEYGTPIDEEYCLYYKNGSCQICVDKCVNDAFVLENGKYKCNREKCAEQIYELNEPPENCDVNESTCGKCMSGVPCSMRRP